MIKNIGIIGAGQMGCGIAHVSASAGYKVHIYDVTQDRIDAGLATINGNLARQVSHGKMTEEQRNAALALISGSSDTNDLAPMDLVIEAATERNMIAIGNMTDQSAINPKTVVSSVIWDPYPIIKASVDAVRGGTFAAKDYSTIENIANGVNYLAPYKTFDDKVPAELKAAIEAKSKEIASGAVKVAYDTAETKSD